MTGGLIDFLGLGDARDAAKSYNAQDSIPQ